MKRLLTIFFLLSFSMASNAQVAKRCHFTVDLGVSFHWVDSTIDKSKSADKDSLRGIVCVGGNTAQFQLRPLNDAYEVISFVISASNKRGDILETINEGSQIQPKAMVVVDSREKNSLVYFDCIKARHRSGVICTLKPASIKIEDIR